MTPPHSSGPDRSDGDEPVPRTPRLRAGDEERDAVLDVLARAHGAGRLDPAEVDERQRHTLRARFVDELPDLIDDLPEGRDLAARFASQSGRGEHRRSPGTLAHAPAGDVVPVAPGSGPPETTVAVMSGREHVVEPGTGLVRSYGLMGGDEIYLGDVMGPGVEVTLECYAMWAGNDVYVPAGVKVLDRTMNLMAGNTIAKNARGDGSNGTVILTGFSLMAGHDVKLDPNWRPRGELAG
ncbi:DUF1707 SHOCT-like domain-containing protein [Brevibacterium jeotgali]|uniref:DUF1707 domain-containing protein n=1 Tax=Brevibacterium jeotgali TaxID=1262550 RepID=A0A2H1L0Q8_9MICO|nr:DUF1707 domain-containing protein [Brevibacterium jeotgali]TWC02166.1 uncharacterized protein DUF1707 [Brevibacterium jeotgali]SMY10484.1 protein of unknown function (DUF1707) [Brevibacterium jeotgali]